MNERVGTPLSHAPEEQSWASTCKVYGDFPTHTQDFPIKREASQGNSSPNKWEMQNPCVPFGPHNTPPPQVEHYGSPSARLEACMQGGWIGALYYCISRVTYRPGVVRP